MQHRKLTFIGAGNMSQAIIAGLVNGGYPGDLICVCAPSATRRNALAQRYGVMSSDDNVAAAQGADVVILAVKPQLIASICKPLRGVLNVPGKLVLSVAAGVSVPRFYELLGEPLTLIRIMPNTPSLVGKGMSGLYAPANVSAEERTFSTKLMQGVGKICWVDEESSINNFIAAAGSAPAYFFLFMEAMQQEAIRQGFTQKSARQLVQQAALGAAVLAEASPETPLATLRENVASKGGTTAEALRVFNERKLTQTVADVMQAVVRRAQEMEKLF
ncbi:MAG: pyrroline-5-carboxylate reductase [Candidatus Malihini olakiniferum]